MAALPVIAKTYRCAFNWRNPSAGGTATNVMHFRTAGSAVSEAAVFACLNSHVTAAMWGAVAGTLFVNDVEITPLDATSASGDFPTGGGAKWTGAGTGDPIPASSSLIKLTTLARGRSFRGRVYLPATGEGDQANGAISGAAGITTAWQAFQTAINADGTTPMSLVIASYKLAIANDVVSLTCEAGAATQRRRQTRLR